MILRCLRTCVLRTRQRPMTARARSVRARTSPAGVPRCERSRACTCTTSSHHNQSASVCKLKARLHSDCLCYYILCMLRLYMADCCRPGPGMWCKLAHTCCNATLACLHHVLTSQHSLDVRCAARKNASAVRTQSANAPCSCKISMQVCVCSCCSRQSQQPTAKGAADPYGQQLFRHR